MLDHQHGEIGGQTGQRRLRCRPVSLCGTPARRLVEQQHLRLQRHRDGDFQQPLLAIGDFADLAVREIVESEHAREASIASP